MISFARFDFCSSLACLYNVVVDLQFFVNIPTLCPSGGLIIGNSAFDLAYLTRYSPLLIVWCNKALAFS
jgi:hypothetical protein